MNIQRYGWRKDSLDKRDLIFSPHSNITLPPLCDLTGLCPPVYDQGALGSCTANAIAGAIEFEQRKQNSTAVAVPSRLFIYYNERVIEGTVASDAGAEIRDGIKSVFAQGVCPETEWVYDISQFAAAPPPSCYKDARKDLVRCYYAVTQTEGHMKACLAAGYPFVVGFTVYGGFETAQVAQDGIVPMPEPGEAPVGGHAVLVVGYDDANKQYIVRNSWGAGWGLKGYFRMPYAYFADPNLASDLWTIRLVEIQ